MGISRMAFKTGASAFAAGQVGSMTALTRIESDFFHLDAMKIRRRLLTPALRMCFGWQGIFVLGASIQQKKNNTYHQDRENNLLHFLTLFKSCTLTGIWHIISPDGTVHK